MAHDNKQHILAGLLIALAVGLPCSLSACTTEKGGVNPLSFKERFGAAAKVAALFVRDGIAQYINGAVTGLEKNAGRLTDKTDGWVWNGIFVVSKDCARIDTRVYTN